MAEKKKRAFSLESGKEENKHFRRCRQEQCGHYINGGCKSCEDCGAKPFLLDKGCKRCYECENVPESLRWGDSKKKASEGLQISEKDVHRALVAIAAKIVAEKAISEIGTEDEPDIEIIIQRPPE